MNRLSRKKFIRQSTLAGIAALLSPISAMALTKNDQKVKVGVIGCGSVSTQYLPHLKKSPYVELVSVCDIIPERAQKAAENYSKILIQ